MKSILLAFILTAGMCSGDRPKMPPQRSHLIGGWIGCAEECNLFFRLELNQHGSGSFVMIFAETPADIYRIENWVWRENKLSLKIGPVATNAEPITVEVIQADFKVLKIIVQSRTNDWSRTLSLFKDVDFQDKAERARRAASAINK